MAKGILEFNLPEERREFDLASNGSQWASALHAVNEKIFNELDEGQPKPARRKALQEILDNICEELEARNLSFDTLA